MESWILDESVQRLPVSILTGFLGSGKTTVLNHLIQQPELSQTLVLINEFGEIGLDHDLVTHAKDDVVIDCGSGGSCNVTCSGSVTSCSQAALDINGGIV